MHLVGFTIETCLELYLEISIVLIMSLMLYVQSWTPDDGRKDRPKYVE